MLISTDGFYIFIMPYHMNLKYLGFCLSELQ